MRSQEQIWCEMKFNSSDHYKDFIPYELLPFKFEKYNNDLYVITNLVGEYLLVKKCDLQQIVDKSLNKNNKIYPDLLSKHIIKERGDKSPISLLALKMRTKFSNLPNFTTLHVFVATLRCDHSCPYCQVSRQCSNTSKDEFDMSEITASKAIEFMFNTPSSSIKIEFQGGEPLLNFSLVKFVVEETKKKNFNYNKELEFVIATTLSLLDDEILDFCALHKIHLSSSLDGPQSLHDKNRPRPNRDSYARFKLGLGKARLKLGYDKVSALMTTTDDSLPIVNDIIDEYLKLGFNSIFLRSLSPYGHAIKRKRFNAYDADRWLEFYKEGLDYIIKLNKSGIPFMEHYASIVLQKMLTSNDPGYVDLMNPTGAGIAAIVFNYDGDVYASDESRMLAEMGDKSFKLGNLHANTYKEIILSDPLLNAIEDSFTLSAPKCSDCAFEQYCGAEPVYHHAMFGDVLGKKPLSDFCNKNIAIFKYLIELMETDKETANILRGWATKC